MQDDRSGVSLQILIYLSVKIKKSCVWAVANAILTCSRTGRNVGLEFDTDLWFRPHINKTLHNAYIILKTSGAALKLKLADH